MNLLTLENVCYSYHGKKENKSVLKGVNYSFEEGKFYAIIGKSGSGKSTMLSLMAGLDLPVDGKVFFEGVATAQMDLDEYRRMSASVIYQNFCLFPLLTVLENILYPMELCHVKEEEAVRKAKELAKKVSLPESLLNRYPSQISGGEQQRVAIARALAMERKIILADEPTGNLDSENSDVIIKLLSNLAKEEHRCVIVVTHDYAVVDSADVVLKIVDGRIKE